MIKNVTLNIWNENDDYLEVDLEPFQVKALISILGLKIKLDDDGAYSITTNGPKTINNILKKIKGE